MKKDELFYITVLLLHVAMGFLFFVAPFLSTVFGVAAVVVGIGYVVNTGNRNNEVLLMAAYCTGLDVYLKMTGGSLLNEYGKYSVIVFMVLGIYYKGFAKGAFLYVFFIVLLIPGIYIGAETLSFDTNIRKAIAFNITGPVCLAVCAIYCFKRSISLKRIQDVLVMFMFPIVAMVIHLFLFTPTDIDLFTGTASNFQTSGGYGPNQVSTVLGLAMFVAFVRLFLASATRKMQLINAALVVIFAYRCIITFSRGGMYTGLAMIVIFLVMMYFILDTKGKGKLVFLSGLSVLAGLMIFTYSSIQTGGMIEKRYANENARGVEKKSAFSGRENLVQTEWQMFIDNPYLGVGVGRNKEIRLEETGKNAASHSEISRMLAEHGSLGLMGLLILSITPVVLYLIDRTQIFALLFMVFWVMTINHAAMRIAAPAFGYALALLKVYFPKDGEAPMA